MEFHAQNLCVHVSLSFLSEQGYNILIPKLQDLCSVEHGLDSV